MGLVSLSLLARRQWNVFLFFSLLVFWNLFCINFAYSESPLSSEDKEASKLKQYFYLRKGVSSQSNLSSKKKPLVPEKVKVINPNLEEAPQSEDIGQEEEVSSVGDTISFETVHDDKDFTETYFYTDYLKAILEMEEKIDHPLKTTLDADNYNRTLKALIESLSVVEKNMMGESIDIREGTKMTGERLRTYRRNIQHQREREERVSLGEVYATLINLLLDKNGLGKCAWPLKFTAETTTAFMTDLESGYQVLTLPFSGLDVQNEPNISKTISTTKNNNYNSDNNDTELQDIEFRLSASYPQVNYFSYQSYDIDGEPFANIIDMSIKAEVEKDVNEEVYIDFSDEYSLHSFSKDSHSNVKRSIVEHYTNKRRNIKKKSIFVEKKMNPYNSIYIKSPLQSGKFSLYFSANKTMLHTYQAKSGKNVLPISIFYLPTLNKYLGHIILRFYGQDPSIIPKSLETNKANDKNTSSEWIYVDEFVQKNRLYLGRLYDDYQKQARSNKRKYSLTDMEIFQVVDPKLKDWGWVDVPKIEYRFIDQEKYQDYEKKIKDKETEEEEEENNPYFSEGWKEYLPCPQQNRDDISEILGTFITNQIFTSLKTLTTESKRETCGDASIDKSKNSTSIRLDARNSDEEEEKRKTVVKNLGANEGSTEIKRDIMASENFFFAPKNSSYDYIEDFKRKEFRSQNQTENTTSPPSNAPSNTSSALSNTPSEHNEKVEIFPTNSISLEKERHRPSNTKIDESILYSIRDHFTFYRGNDYWKPDAEIPYVNQNADYLGWCGTTMNDNSNNNINLKEEEGQASLNPSPNLVIKLRLTLPTVARGLYPFYGRKIANKTKMKEKTKETKMLNGASDTVEEIVNGIEELSEIMEDAFYNKKKNARNGIEFYCEHFFL